MSIASLESSSLPLSYTPLARFSLAGRSTRGFWLNPYRSMYLNSVLFPSFTPTSAQTVLTEFVSAWVSVIGPNCSPPKFDNGTPSMIFGDLPLTTESGV